jgi:hypothetical protein
LLLLVGAALVLCGCQAKESPVSPAAATFKQEIKNCLDNLSAALKGPIANKDLAGITAALEKVESPAVKLCRLCPFQIGVLNQSGEALAVYPPKRDDKGRNFSNYELIIKSINSKKIQQQRFFLQDGSKLYIICAPLIREDAVIGLIAIAIDSEDAHKKWGLNEKDFLSLDFNP